MGKVLGLQSKERPGWMWFVESVVGKQWVKPLCVSEQKSCRAERLKCYCGLEAP